MVQGKFSLKNLLVPQYYIRLCIKMGNKPDAASAFFQSNLFNQDIATQ
jgi:hypothetical protein